MTKLRYVTAHFSIDICKNMIGVEKCFQDWMVCEANEWTNDKTNVDDKTMARMYYGGLEVRGDEV